MITGVAFVPQAPALVPEIGRGLEAELGPLRDACRTAIRRVATPGTSVTVVANGDSAVGYGVEIGVPTIGDWLVLDALGPRDDVAHLSVRGEPDDLKSLLDDDRPTALVVVGDGSARRTEKAPGYLDPRAADTDAAVAGTLRRGDGTALHFPFLERDELAGGTDLLAAGVDVWAAVAWLLEPTKWDAELLYDDAPFGVGYFVATWLRA